MDAEKDNEKEENEEEVQSQEQQKQQQQEKQDTGGSKSSVSAQDIYRKQVQRIEELEKENKRLAAQSDDATLKFKQVEDELELLRADSGEVAELKKRAGQADGRADEIDKLVLQLLLLSVLILDMDLLTRIV